MEASGVPGLHNWAGLIINGKNWSTTENILSVELVDEKHWGTTFYGVVAAPASSVEVLGSSTGSSALKLQSRCLCVWAAGARAWSDLQSTWEASSSCCDIRQEGVHIGEQHCPQVGEAQTWATVTYVMLGPVWCLEWEWHPLFKAVVRMELMSLWRLCGRDQLMVVVAVWRLMVLKSLEGKGVALSQVKILGPGLPGRTLSVYVSTLGILIRN